MTAARHEAQRGLPAAVRAVGILGISLALGGLLALVSRVLLGRSLTIDEFGSLWTAISGAVLLLPLASFGVSQFWLLAYNEEGLAARRWGRPTVELVLMTCLASVAVLAVWSLLASGSELGWLPLIVSPLLILYAVEALSAARYTLEERYAQVALVQIADKFALFAAAAATAAFGWGVVGSAWAMFVICLAVAVILLPTTYPVVVGRVRLPPSALARTIASRLRQAKSRDSDTSLVELHILLHWRKEGGEVRRQASIVNAARRAWPFALAAISYTIFQQVDVVLLNSLEGPEAAGVYTAAVTLVIGVYLVPAAVERFLAPKFFRWSEQDRNTLRFVFQRASSLLALTGLLAAIALGVSAEWSIPGLFGSEYEAAVGQLQILAIGVAFRFAATAASALLNTRSNARRKSTIMTAAALTNLTLNVALIPIFGITGASIATVVSEIALAIGFWIAARNDLKT